MVIWQPIRCPQMSHFRIAQIRGHCLVSHLKCQLSRSSSKWTGFHCFLYLIVHAGQSGLGTERPSAHKPCQQLSLLVQPCRDQSGPKYSPTVSESPIVEAVLQSENKHQKKTAISLKYDSTGNFLLDSLDFLVFLV